MDLSGTTRGELPIPMTAAVVSGAGHAHNGQQQQQQQMMMMAPLMSAPAAAEAESNNKAAAPGIGFGKKRPASASAGNGGGGALAVKYRECLKNHAAAIGGNATDGCGEFMASGEDGSLEALKCSACGCHRNFHRKDVDDDLAALGRRLLLAPPHPRGVFPGSGADHHGLPPRQIVMPLSMVHHSSESDDMDGGHGLGLGGAALLPRSVGGHGGGSSSSQQQQQKRFRTKFTAEQKARMLAFAERVGWRLQRAEDAAVQRFCAEAGVKRRVLKVWMHNNKHSLATKLTSTSPLPIQAQGQPPMAPAPVNSMPPPQEPGPSSSPPQDGQLSQLE